jgi:hypothetical protein
MKICKTSKFEILVSSERAYQTTYNSVGRKGGLLIIFPIKFAMEDFASMEQPPLTRKLSLATRPMRSPSYLLKSSFRFCHPTMISTDDENVDGSTNFNDATEKISAILLSDRNDFKFRKYGEYLDRFYCKTIKNISKYQMFRFCNLHKTDFF